MLYTMARRTIIRSHAFLSMWRISPASISIRRFLDNPQRPVDELVRWHFRQAVLANMKGAGEPIFEHELPARL